MSDFQEDHDELLDLEQAASAEELQDQVKRAQAELLQLRQKQDQIEKEKQRLEDLTRRQEELERGRNEIADKLSRALILVQRETEESQRRLEQLNGIQDSFAEHLRNLEEIDPKSWPGRDLPRELTRALGTVDVPMPGRMRRSLPRQTRREDSPATAPPPLRPILATRDSLTGSVAGWRSLFRFSFSARSRSSPGSGT